MSHGRTPSRSETLPLLLLPATGEDSAPGDQEITHMDFKDEVSQASSRYSLYVLSIARLFNESLLNINY